MKRWILIITMLTLSLSLAAQADKKDGRVGNRKYKRGEYREAQISYLKGLVKDSLSVASNYNLASALYAQKDYKGAAEQLGRISEQSPLSQVHYNMGNAALQMEDYAAAVQAFKQSLLIDPEDLTAKESYIYAKKKLQDQQQNQQQDQQQNQDQNQDQDQDQNQDQNQDQDENQSDDQQDQGQNQQDQNQPQQQPQQSPDNQISKQQAQQMLRAIQAQEKETQDKVNKEKAALLQSQQKEKNW